MLGLFDEYVAYAGKQCDAMFIMKSMLETFTHQRKQDVLGKLISHFP
jgi:hypothetical protein